MAAHGQQVLPQGFHLISLLRRQLPLKGKPMAAHGQLLLNLGYALAPPLGELASSEAQMTERVSPAKSEP